MGMISVVSQAMLCSAVLVSIDCCAYVSAGATHCSPASATEAGRAALGSFTARCRLGTHRCRSLCQRRTEKDCYCSSYRTGAAALQVLPEQSRELLHITLTCAAACVLKQQQHTSDQAAQLVHVVQSYQNLAARTDASLVTYPPEVALPPNPTPISIPAAVSVPPPGNKTAAVASPNADGLPEADVPSAEEEPHEAVGSPEQLPNKKRKLGEPKVIAQDELLDDDIDWAAPSSVAADAAAASEAPSEADALHAAIGDTQGALQLKAGMQASPHGTQHTTETRADEPPDPGSPQHHSDAKRIQHAVNKYIRAFLDPFYKAGIVTKEVWCSQDLRCCTAGCTALLDALHC